MITTRSLAAALCIALAAAAGQAHAAPEGRAQPAHTAQARLPDTPAGRCVAAYIKAMNAGTDEAVRAFEEEHRSTASLAARPMEDRLKQAAELRTRWGRLSLRKVAEASATRLPVLIDTANEGTMEFAFELDPSEPSKLRAIMITGPIDPDEPPLTEADLRETIETLAESLTETYVFPEKAEEMAEVIRQRLAAGEYRDASSPRQLARRLTEDLREICRDKHLTIVPEARRPEGESGPDLMARRAEENFGFKKVEILPGNVGYVRFDAFADDEGAREAAAAALAFVKNCDALIFDLRHNGGGSPEQIRFISSYLFDEPTHLNSFYDRLGNKTEEYWTLSEIPGQRFRSDLPVYVLTSNYTFSGAEEFSYNLKNLGRATIVGETTGGGAHPVQGVRLNDRFTAMIPFARAENPISKTNWEGVGVAPDIDVPAGDALGRALEEIAAKSGPARIKRSTK